MRKFRANIVAWLHCHHFFSIGRQGKKVGIKPFKKKTPAQLLLRKKNSDKTWNSRKKFLLRKFTLPSPRISNGPPFINLHLDDVIFFIVGIC